MWLHLIIISAPDAASSSFYLTNAAPEEMRLKGVLVTSNILACFKHVHVSDAADTLLRCVCTVSSGRMNCSVVLNAPSQF